MQTSQSGPGRVAAAIKAAAVANRVPPPSPAQISHGHEENEPAPHTSVGDLLADLTGKPRGSETPAPPG